MKKAGRLGAVLAAAAVVMGSFPVQAAANPFEEYTSLHDAQTAAGFQMDVPVEVPEGYADPIYRVIPGDLLEIVYTNEEGEDFRVRKGVSEGGDISGDYNEYDTALSQNIGPMPVKAEGNDGRIYKVTASARGYDYSVTFDGGIEEEEYMSLRRAFLNDYLPAIVTGMTKEELEAFMDCSYDLLYELNAIGAVLYSDPADPDWYFYIPVSEDGEVLTLLYEENQVYTLEGESSIQ